MPRCTAVHFKAPMVLLTLLLAGCSALSPYSNVTKLDLTLSASDQVNPDVHGRASPVVIRLLELKHPVAFENADFFSVYERADSVLAQDLLISEELELRPGETVSHKLSVAPVSRYVGVLAAYRDLPQTRWRYVITLSPEQITQAHLVLDQTGIRRADDVNPDAGDEA